MIETALTEMYQGLQNIKSIGVLVESLKELKIRTLEYGVEKSGDLVFTFETTEGVEVRGELEDGSLQITSQEKTSHYAFEQEFKFEDNTLAGKTMSVAEFGGLEQQMKSMTHMETSMKNVVSEVINQIDATQNSIEMLIKNSGGTDIKVNIKER